MPWSSNLSGAGLSPSSKTWWWTGAPWTKSLSPAAIVSVNTGQAPEANTLPVPKDNADLSMDAAACIGCGACVAACPNAAAMLFVAAKVSHLGLLPQGRPEAARRALSMVAQMDAQGFGNCTNHKECEMECPKGISISHIARLNREFLKAAFWSREKIPGLNSYEKDCWHWLSEFKTCGRFTAMVATPATVSYSKFL